MTRDDVLEKIRAHLADELELDPARIEPSTRFREDLAADSLDLYTLVQELDDTYGVKISDGPPELIRNDPKVIAAYLGVADEDVAKVEAEVGL